MFVDAPGQQTQARNTLHRPLNRRATEAARDADVALFVVEALRFGPDDHAVLERSRREQRIVAAVNKIDTVKKRAQLIPFLDRLSKTREFAAIVPVSAKTGRNIPELLKRCARRCPRRRPRIRPTSSPTATSASSPPSSCARSCSRRWARSCRTAARW